MSPEMRELNIKQATFLTCVIAAVPAAIEAGPYFALPGTRCWNRHLRCGRAGA